MILPIDPNREYSPMEIVRNGWILNNRNKPDYYFVLKLIKAGRLKARNVSLADQKYFRILGKYIIEYRNKIYGTGDNTDPINNESSEVLLPQDQ